MRISILSGLGAGLVLAVATACGGSSATPAPPAGGGDGSAVSCHAGTGTGQQVAMANIAFAPTTSSVSSGGTVTWTNGDQVDHTVTFDSGPDCGHVAAGQSMTVTFTAAGTYGYHCTIHPQMKGTVTVS